jgi:hypothetical protein
MTNAIKKWWAAGALAALVVLGFGLALGLARIAEARAEVPLIEPLAATGPHVAAWALTAADPAELGGIVTSPTMDAPDPAPDPIDNPSGALETVRTAWAAGRYALAAIIALWLLARIAFWVSTRWPSSAPVRWLRLDRPAYRGALVTGLGLLASIAAAIAADGDVDWRVVAGALATALALYLTPTPAPTAQLGSSGGKSVG